MKNIRHEILVWVQLCSFIGIWICLLLISSSTLQINVEALKKLPDVVTIYALLALIFTKWAWKLPVFKKWLVPFPNLQGTWFGRLESTWVNPSTGERVPPKGVALVIKQTYTSMSCVMYTDESESYSTTAQINEDDDSGVLRLSYGYTNRSRATVRDRSAIHDGASILRITNGSENKLEGEYWTSRKTTGEISVKLVSKELARSFSEAEGMGGSNV